MLAEPGRDHKNMNYRVGEKVTKSSRFRKKVLAFVSVSITFVFVMATAPLSSVPKATGGWEFYRNPYIAGLWHPPGNETLEGPLKSDHKVVCAYQQTGGRCDLMWCNDAEGTQSRPHYSLGLVHREKKYQGNNHANFRNSPGRVGMCIVATTPLYLHPCSQVCWNDRQGFLEEGALRRNKDACLPPRQRYP